MESTLKNKISKINKFLSSDSKTLNMSNEIVALLKEEKLKKKKSLNKKINNCKGIMKPLKSNVPKRKIILPEVSHNFLHIA